MAIASQLQPFMILGHGHEDIQTNFEARPTLPEGYTLVTLSECGVVTVMDTVARFLEAFKEPTNAPIFSDPANPIHKKKIQEILGGQKIHVYKSGNKYPNLTIQALVDWVDMDKDRIRLMKSGLYSFPIDKGLFIAPYNKGYPQLTNMEFEDTRVISPDFREPIAALYEGSIFPTSQVVAPLLEQPKINLRKVEKAVTFPLEKFFEAGGPGVYFYIICRSPAELDFRNFLIQSANKNLSERFEKAQNIIPLIPELLPKAKANAAKEAARVAKPDQKKTWSTQYTLELPGKLESLYKRTMRTRRASVNQQGEKPNSGSSGSSGGSRHKRTRRRRQTKKRKPRRH